MFIINTIAAYLCNTTFEHTFLVIKYRMVGVYGLSFYCSRFANLKKSGKLVTLFLLILFYLFLRYVVSPTGLSFGDPKPTLNLVSDFGLLRCLAGFLTGMLLFEFYKDKTGYTVLKKSWCFAAFFLAALACMHFGVTDIIILAFFPFILISAAYNATWVKRILDTALLQKLGDWSFSIYMVHIPIIWMFTILAVNKNPALFADLMKLLSQKPNYQLGGMMCIVVVGLTILIASFTYRFIELPARNYLNNAFKTKEKGVKAVSIEYNEQQV
jgi:peptidoglycan/LPS O-acetylase OafA/YrhL